MEPLTISLAAVAAAAFGVLLDDPLPSAEKLLAEFEAKTACAAGPKTLRVKGTFTVAGMPGGGTFEEVFFGNAGPDGGPVKIAIDFPGMGGMTQGRAGKRAWTTDPALGVAVKEGAEAAPVRAQYGLFRLDPWRTHYSKAETVGRADVFGRPHFEVRLTAGPGEKGATWFVDAETKLLSRADLVLPDPSGGDLPMQWEFADWKKAGEKLPLFPHLKTQVVGGMRIEYAAKSVEPDAALAPDAAAPPAEVLAAMNDPAKRTPQAPAQGGECEIVTVTEQPIASIRMKIPAAEVSRHLAIMLPEVMQHVAKSGAEMAGPPLSRYHSITADTIDIEAAIPVKKAVTPGGRVKSETLPGGKTATTWHVGAYHDLPKSYAVLEAFIAKRSLAARAPFWEVYWTDPGIERDPAKWRTQILWPVQ